MKFVSYFLNLLVIEIFLCVKFMGNVGLDKLEGSRKKFFYFSKKIVFIGLTS